MLACLRIASQLNLQVQDETGIRSLCPKKVAERDLRLTITLCVVIIRALRSRR